MKPNVLSLLILGVPTLVACTNGSPEALRLTASAPCPPGRTAVETWCNDARECEYRVVGATTYECDPYGMMPCWEAERIAFDECRNIRWPSYCTDLCNACSAQQCEECMKLESLAGEHACDAELDNELWCRRDHPCSPDVGACSSQHNAFVECACSRFIVDIRDASLDCDRPWFDGDCTTDSNRARVIACALELRPNGCPAFDTPECSNDL